MSAFLWVVCTTKVKSVVTENLHWCNGGKNSAVYKKSGTSNPVIVLDEIDKIGQGIHGDPSSAF
jgi:hypothetical protein